MEAVLPMSLLVKAEAFRPVVLWDKVAMTLRPINGWWWVNYTICELRNQLVLEQKDNRCKSSSKINWATESFVDPCAFVLGCRVLRRSEKPDGNEPTKGCTREMWGSWEIIIKPSHLKTDRLALRPAIWIKWKNDLKTVWTKRSFWGRRI